MSSVTEARRSIAGTLMILITGVTAALVLASSLVLYQRFAAIQEEEIRQRLTSKIAFVQAELGRAGAASDPEEEELDDIRAAIEGENASGLRQTFIEILDESGGRRMISGEAALMGALAPFFPTPALSWERIEIVQWEHERRPFALTAAWVDVPALGERRLARIALDRTAEDRALTHMLQLVAVVVLAGIALAGLAARAITARSLRPLQSLAEAVRSIRAERLDRSLAAGGYPRELEPLAREFDAMQQRLRSSFERLSQFSADLAHELRTPVTNLMGETEVALSRTRTSEEYREVLGSSLEELARLAKLIDSLLFIARSDSESLTLELSRLDLADEAAAVIDFYEFMASEKALEVTLEGNAAIEGDRTLVRRALSNLLSNAIRYSGYGSSIVISIAAGERGAGVEVRDSGPGIAERHLARVFDRFYRADEARSSHPQGSGLGLPIVRSIMTMHRGEVSIASLPGAGTTVTLLFPPSRAV